MTQIIRNDWLDLSLLDWCQGPYFAVLGLAMVVVIVAQRLTDLVVVCPDVIALLQLCWCSCTELLPQ